VIGENLALGNFLNDQELVQGWMDSPGHRANILHQQYTELGVAVLQGTYQGETTWIAVQHFGKPLSACAQPSSGLNQQIETNKQRLTQMAADLQARQEELAQMDQNHPEYNQKVDEYNQRVEEYNRLISETEQLVNTYNEQVAAFNRCAAS
jgi:chromosome segregation ATPase